jgi:hypothetical protein
MKTITTKYTGPGEKRGSRIIARSEGNSVQVSVNDYSGSDTAHKAAAEKLRKKLGWKDRLLDGGTLPDGKTQVWISAAQIASHCRCR